MANTPFDEWPDQHMERLAGMIEDLHSDLGSVEAEMKEMHGTVLARIADLRQDVNSVSDGLQDLRRDLEAHAVLPPVAEAG